MLSPLDKTIDSNAARIDAALKAVDRRIIALMGKLKTDSSGFLLTDDINLATAMDMRSKIYEQMSPYLTTSKDVTGTFTEAAKYVKKRMADGGFDVAFTEADAGIMDAYQQDTFQSLASIGQQYASTIGNSIYTAAIAGTPFDELAADISQALIGGVTAHGMPLSHYAKTYAHTGLMELDSTLFKKKAAEAGLEKFIYFGSTVQDTRDWCVHHHGKTFTLDEIKAWGDSKWQGKKAGDPFIVRGGWNCRHHWIADIGNTISSKTATPKTKAKTGSAKHAQTPEAMRAAGTKTRKAIQKSMGLSPDAAMTGSDRSAFIAGMFKHIRKVRSFDKVEAAITGSGKAAPMVRDASLSFPDSWVKSANDLGPLHTRYGRGRGFHITLGERYDGKQVRVGGGFGVHNASTGDGFIKAGRPSTALHEYVHRLQSALPGVDKIFQDEHRARTKGDKLKRLRDITGVSYRYDEVTREDHYVTPYVGKEYNSGDAKEVMTIAFEYLLGGSEVNFEALYFIDREMFDMTIGILEHA